MLFETRHKAVTAGNILPMAVFTQERPFCLSIGLLMLIKLRPIYWPDYSLMPIAA